MRRYDRQQARGFTTHDFITLAGQPLELRPVQHLDVSAPIADHAGVLKLSSGLGDALTPHSEHVCDQFLRGPLDSNFSRRKP